MYIYGAYANSQESVLLEYCQIRLAHWMHRCMNAQQDSGWPLGAFVIILLVNLTTV